MRSGALAELDLRPAALAQVLERDRRALEQLFDQRSSLSEKQGSSSPMRSARSLNVSVFGLASPRGSIAGSFQVR